MISNISTAKQLSRMVDDGHRYELVAGVLNKMSPAEGRHGRITARINKLLANHVDDNNLGVTSAAETGFLLATDPDTVRAPDAAFVVQERLDSLDDDVGFLPFAPDLAVEVVSPSDTFTEVENKAFMWLDYGAKLVLIVEPTSEAVHAYRSRANMVVLRSTELLDAGDSVPGWKPAVVDFFR